MLIRVPRWITAGLIAGLLAHPAAAQTEPSAPSDDAPAAHSDSGGDRNGGSRIAFVSGNANYAQGPIDNALKDAGLVAEALRIIGFEVVEGADLDHAAFIRSYREFLDKVTQSGQDTTAFVYISGYGFAFEGDNHLALSDARIERPSDVSLGTVRFNDLIRPLAATPARAKIMAIDASRPLPFSMPDRPLARGLAAIEAEPTMLIGFAAAPGTVAEYPRDGYGAYAKAIAEMIRAPGLDLNAVFTQVRVRTHQLTDGKQTPFHVMAAMDASPLVPPDARSDTGAAPPVPRIASDDTKPLQDIGVDEAYARTIERDTLAGYEEFANAYPESPYTERVRAIARARREALLWMRTLELDTAEAYWTYLQRYPDGMYAADAEYRLNQLQAAADPPQNFAPVEYADVPLPPPEEPVALADDWPWAPLPVALIAPPSVIFIHISRPRGVRRPGVLPRRPGRRPALRPPRRPGAGREPPRRVDPRSPRATARLPRPSDASMRSPRPAARSFPQPDRLRSARPPVGRPRQVNRQPSQVHQRPSIRRVPQVRHQRRPVYRQPQVRYPPRYRQPQVRYQPRPVYRQPRIIYRPQRIYRPAPQVRRPVQQMRRAAPPARQRVCRGRAC